MKWKFLSFSLVFYYFHFFLVSTDWIWIGEDESPGTDMATLAGLFLHVVSLAGRWHARGARWFTGRHDHHEFSNKKKRRGEEAKKLALTGDVIPEMEIFHLLPLRLIHWALDNWNEFETKIWIFGDFSEEFPFLDEAPASPAGGTWMDEIEIIWKFEFLAPFSDESPHKSPRWDSNWFSCCIWWLDEPWKKLTKWKVKRGCPPTCRSRGGSCSGGVRLKNGVQFHGVHLKGTVRFLTAARISSASRLDLTKWGVVGS